MLGYILRVLYHFKDRLAWSLFRPNFGEKQPFYHWRESLGLERERDLNCITEMILNSLAFITLFIVSLAIHLFKHYSDHHNHVSYEYV